MRTRLALIVISSLIMIASILPLLGVMDVSISGFSVAESIQNSRLPQSATPYFLVIFVLALIGIIYGAHSRNVVIH